MGPHCKGPTPLSSAGVPPGLPSNPNEFGNAFQNFFLSEKRSKAMTCRACHASLSSHASHDI